MRTLAVVALIALLPAPALASATCWTIHDPDERAYCRAISSGSVGDCSVIADYAKRQTCRSRLSTTRASADAACNSVSSAWEREKCRDAAKRH